MSMISSKDLIQAKIQLLEDRVQILTKKLESLKSTVTLTRGASQAVKEVRDSYDGFVSKKNEEYAALVKENKLSPELASLLLGQVRSVKSYIEEKMFDYEKINYVRQGETIAVNDELQELKSQIGALTEELKSVEKSTEADPTSEVQEDTAVVVIEKPKGPVRDPKMLRAVEDLKKRRLSSTEKVPPSEATKPTRGRPKK